MDINEEETVEIAERREKLLQRLAQRNDSAKSRSAGLEAKAHEAEIDKLLAQVRDGLTGPGVGDDVVEKLEQIAAMSEKGHRTKRIFDALEQVRSARLASRQTTEKKQGFSFKKNSAPKAVSSIQKSVEKVDSKQEVAEKEKKEVDEKKAIGISEGGIIENWVSANMTLEGEDGSDLAIKNITSSRIVINFRPSAVHIRNVENSTLVMLPCERSILIHDCKNTTLFAAAQQIRVHTSTDLRLHVSVRGAVILEECTQVQMAPYRVKSSDGAEVEVEGGDEWRRPKDFDWLADGQSPNWKIADENEWKFEKI